MKDNTIEFLLDDSTTSIGKAYQILRRRDVGVHVLERIFFTGQTFSDPPYLKLDEEQGGVVSNIIAAVTCEYKREFGKVEHFLGLLCNHLGWAYLSLSFRTGCVLGLLRGVTALEGEPSPSSIGLDNELLSLLLRLAWTAPEGTPIKVDARGELSNLVALYGRLAGETRRTAIGRFLMAASERLKLTNGVYPSPFAEAVVNEFYYKWDNASPLHERLDRVGRLLAKGS